MAQNDQGNPMMKQFYSFKAKHPDALLLFRCGDFYETYSEDAVEASRVLGITLTKRNNKGNTDATEMASVFPIMRWIPICLSSSGRANAWLYATNWKTPN